MEPKKLEQFLNELSELSRKYKIVIGGCGCCGSPFLSDLEVKSDELTTDGKYTCKDDDNLRWDCKK